MKALVASVLVIVVLVVVAVNMYTTPMVNSAMHGAQVVAHTDTSGVRPISAEGPFKALTDFMFCMANNNNINACK